MPETTPVPKHAEWRAISRRHCLAALATAVALGAASAFAQEDAHAKTAADLAEIRRAFTLHGKPIPPEVFRDMGDGDMADSGSIWVTVDLEAAVGSNLYADEVREDHGWRVQKKAPRKDAPDEETSYRYIGATENGLLVAIAAYNGGGSGVFTTLHILDLAPARAFDLDGKLYTRLNLTQLRSVALGDRWDGDVKISRNDISIDTRRGGPNEGAKAPMTIVARRP